jgi:hypothetical protein
MKRTRKKHNAVIKAKGGGGGGRRKKNRPVMMIRARWPNVKPHPSALPAQSSTSPTPSGPTEAAGIAAHAVQAHGGAAQPLPIAVIDGPKHFDAARWKNPFPAKPRVPGSMNKLVQVQRARRIAGCQLRRSRRSARRPRS